MPLVELEGDRILIHTEYRHRELTKQVPGVRYDRDMMLWSCPVSWAACVQLRGVFQDELEIGPNLAAWASNEYASRVNPCLYLRDAEDSPAGLMPIYRGEDLEPRQRAGVAFLCYAQQACLADGMGSGKTVQLICALETLDDLGAEAFPALIICPNSMVHKWVDEWNTWAPHRKAVMVKGGAAKRRKIMDEGADVYVINWEGLRTHSRLAPYGNIRLTEKEKEPKELNGLGLRTVIADEAHRGKSPRAQQTRAWWWLSWQATFRYAATGTPVANSPEDAWSIMHGVAPREYPSKVAFIERYALQSWNNFGGMTVVGLRGETREEFFKFFDARFIRRPTQVVIPNIAKKLPPQIRTIELGTKQRKAYDDLRKEMLTQLDSGVLTATNPLTRLTRLLQLASAYGEVNEEGNLLLTEPSAKLDALDDLYEELGDEPVVVFAESKQLINLAAARCAKAKLPFGLITGDIKPSAREEAVRSFQNGDLRALLVTLGAGGEGLTLTATRFPVFLQRSFSLIKNLQAVDRAWRRGQERDVQPIIFKAENTVEDRVEQVGWDKEDRLEEITRDAETLRRLLAP